MLWTESLLVCLVSLLCVSALPVQDASYIAFSLSKTSTSLERKDQPNSEAVANGAALRIFPVGASIVYGQGSKYGDGFRRAFRSALVADGSEVNMVGSRKVGLMGDNECDGWPGLRIAQIQAIPGVKTSLLQKPNVVLVLAGTNDALQGHDAISMLYDMYSFLLFILQHAGISTTVIVSTLPPNARKNAESTIETYNAALPILSKAFQDAGRRVLLVDNHNSWWSTADLQSDGTHPNNGGYLKMARVFYAGVHEAGPWMTQPVNTSLPFMGPGDPASIGPPPALPMQLAG